MSLDLQASLQKLLKPIVDELIAIRTKIETVSTGEENLAILAALSDLLRQVSFNLERLRVVLEREQLNSTDLNREQILRIVAQSRIEKYPTLAAAAKSLGIDVRTLVKYANSNEDLKSRRG